MAKNDIATDHLSPRDAEVARDDQLATHDAILKHAPVHPAVEAHTVLKNRIAALRAQIANGSHVTIGQVDELIADVEALAGKIPDFAGRSAAVAYDEDNRGSRAAEAGRPGSGGSTDRRLDHA